MRIIIALVMMNVFIDINAATVYIENASDSTIIAHLQYSDKGAITATLAFPVLLTYLDKSVESTLPGTPIEGTKEIEIKAHSTEYVDSGLIGIYSIKFYDSDGTFLADFNPDIGALEIFKRVVYKSPTNIKKT